MVFLFSSFSDLPDLYFSGYCFVGGDYIFGQKGMESFCSHKGQAIPPGEDGCYISVRRVNNYHDIGVDYSGHKKLFFILMEKTGVYQIP